MSGVSLILRGFLQMATLTTSLIVMRWELLSAVMMFFASTMKIRLRQNSHHVMALLCGGIGVGMSCWFVTGLLGITLSMENLHNFMEISKNAFIEVMSQTPTDWPMP
jgi:hypothetical protein